MSSAVQCSAVQWVKPALRGLLGGIWERRSGGGGGEVLVF